jgi:hypothetical protein
MSTLATPRYDYARPGISILSPTVTLPPDAFVGGTKWLSLSSISPWPRPISWRIF